MKQLLLTALMAMAAMGAQAEGGRPEAQPWKVAPTENEAAMGAQAEDYEYEAVEGDLMKARIYTLTNGLKVYLTVNDEKPRIQTYIAVRTGSRNDPAETTGLAHYLEHLMFKGTRLFGTTDYEAEKPLLDDIERRFELYRATTDEAERRRMYEQIDSVSQLAAKYNIPNEYDKLMAIIGSQGTNAFTSQDITCYQENIPANELENYLRVQADRFQNMVVRGFHTELEAVYEEKNISLAKDMQKAVDAMYAMLFPNHPYGTQTTLGTQDHLKNPSISNIKKYFHQYYAPNNVAIAMSGDLDPDSTIRLIDKHLGAWQPNPNIGRPEFEDLEPITEPRDTSVYGQEAENVIIAWRFGGEKELSTDTLDVICQLIANGRAGLFETDLEQTMRLQAVSAGTHALADYTAMLLHAVPLEGGSLEEARALLMDELEKMKRGDWDESLLEAVKNNMKLDHQRSLLDNGSRAMSMVGAFVSGKPWSQEATRMERIMGMKKEEITAFIKQHMGEACITVYKRCGETDEAKKIEKPHITPIPSNRDLASHFLMEMQQEETKPLEPRFVDYKKDLSLMETPKGQPIIYKHNETDDLFDLTFRYDIGTEDFKDLGLVASYLYYIGTDEKTSMEIKQELYGLACDYSIAVGQDEMAISLSGLSENMEKALKIVEDFLLGAKGDKEAYGSYLALIGKARQDARANQQSCFQALTSYGLYGEYNPALNVSSTDELAEAGEQYLPDLLKRAMGTSHEVLYFGPYAEKEIAAFIDAHALRRDAPLRASAPALSAIIRVGAPHEEPAPAHREYRMEEVAQDEIVMAPYDAKNIYMLQYSNVGRLQSAEEEALKMVFNEYFGGGMNSIVFQELREARALAYSASARYSWAAERDKPEWFITSIISQNDKMMDCIGTFNGIIAQMPMSEAAFDIAKQSIKKGIESRRVTRMGVINNYLTARKRGVDYDMQKRVYEALPSLTLDDIEKFEKENVAGKPTRYIILGPEEELDMEALEKIGPIKRLKTEDIMP